MYNVAGGIKAWEAGVAVGPPDLGMDLFVGREEPLEVLKTAYSLEEGLRDFYVSMADKAGEPKVASLFLKLSEIEVKHQESIVDAYRGMGHPDITAGDFRAMVDEKAVEGGMSTDAYLAMFDPDLSSAVEVISLAMSIEAQALDLYRRVAADVKDTAAKGVVLSIADEEKVHLKSLGKLMETL